MPDEDRENAIITREDRDIICDPGMGTDSESRAITSVQSYGIPQCSMCNKIFKHRQGLIYHAEHRVCQKYICTNCGQRFKSVSGFRYHTQQGVCRPKPKVKLHIRRKTDYHTYTIAREELDLDIVKRLIPGFVDCIFNTEQNIIPQFIELALANPKMDQYWSYYIPNKREPYIAVYDGDKWLLRPQQAEYQILCKWALDQIFRALSGYKGRDARLYWTKYYLAKDQLEHENSAFVKRIRHGLHCLFVTQKKMLQRKSAETGLSIKI